MYGKPHLHEPTKNPKSCHLGNVPINATICPEKLNRHNECNL